MRVSLVSVSGCLVALVYSSPAASQNAAPARSAVASAPAAPGQPALSVGFDNTSQLRARVCPALPCAIDAGSPLNFPAELQKNIAQARLAVLRIAPQRRAIWVTVPDRARQREWQAIVVAPLAGSVPQIVFEGWTGLIEGEYGERRGPMVLVSSSEGGRYNVVIGEQREDLDLCGRPAVIAPKLLSPTDLKLYPAKVQRLSPEARALAERVTAEPIADASAPVGTYPLLRAVAATSAVGNPQALTDGKLETTWAENRGGAGRGEFVLMRAPQDLPITAFEVAIRPPAGTAPGTSPKEFFLATRTGLIHATLPEDAWQKPGVRYAIKLAKPIQTDCVALVTESAFDESTAAKVTFSELSARTEFDAAQVEGLVGALAGGGERALAAASALGALGEPGFAAIAAGFDRLDEGGRRVALDTLDAAPCPLSAPVFVRALISPFRAHRMHARARIHRCGAAAADALEAALSTLPPRAGPLLASELALVAPDRAVLAIGPRLAVKDPEPRRLFRVALARASHAEVAAPAIRKLLADRSLPVLARIDVLRALSDRIQQFLPEAASALQELVAARPDFRTRYLLLEPAARLARSDAAARAWLERALGSDPSPYVRAQAARVLVDVGPHQNTLLRNLSDAEVRVRQASVETLGKAHSEPASPYLVGRLQKDAWPLVRGSAATALAALGPSSERDRALAGALEDESEQVRIPALLALGERRARAHAEDVRDRLTDRDETPQVRAAAATALGTMCDSESADVLTDQARKLADPTLFMEQRTVAAAALSALARLKPADLRRRLEPLLGKEVATPVQQAARAALTAPASCGQGR